MASNSVRKLVTVREVIRRVNAILPQDPICHDLVLRQSFTAYDKAHYGPFHLCDRLSGMKTRTTLESLCRMYDILEPGEELGE